jgi:hypothetical protein
MAPHLEATSIHLVDHQDNLIQALVETLIVYLDRIKTKEMDKRKMLLMTFSNFELIEFLTNNT